jgi:hypothetical protein
VSTTRRGFLAFLGLGGAAAIAPKIAHAKDGCSCPHENYRRGERGAMADGVTLHMSAACEVHGGIARKRGCGVYCCDWLGCDNPSGKTIESRLRSIDEIHADLAKQRAERPARDRVRRREFRLLDYWSRRAAYRARRG